MKATKSFVAGLAATALTFLLIPSSIGSAGGGGGTVAGKCGTITTIAASSVQLSSSTGGYSTTSLQLRGEVFNCSVNLQSYWIDFDEPTNTNATCKAAFSLFNALLLSSGSRQGFTATTNIAPTGVASSANCVGTHTVRAVLRARSDGSVLQTVYVNYTVALR